MGRLYSVFAFIGSRCCLKADIRVSSLNVTHIANNERLFSTIETFVNQQLRNFVVIHPACDSSKIPCEQINVSYMSES